MGACGAAPRATAESKQRGAVTIHLPPRNECRAIEALLVGGADIGSSGGLRRGILQPSEVWRTPIDGCVTSCTRELSKFGFVRKTRSCDRRSRPVSLRRARVRPRAATASAFPYCSD